MHENGFLQNATNPSLEWDVCADLVYTSSVEYSLSRLCSLCTFYCRKTAFGRSRTTINYVSAVILMSVATQFVACSFCLTIGSSCNSIVVFLASLTAPSIFTDAYCMGTFLRRMGNIPKMHLSINVVSRKDIH